VLSRLREMVVKIRYNSSHKKTPVFLFLLFFRLSGKATMLPCGHIFGDTTLYELGLSARNLRKIMGMSHNKPSRCFGRRE
ncbi:MAG: hypothetical protein QXT77_09135, partial [Candidatus Methanomethylicaceae archaeon]